MVETAMTQLSGIGWGIIKNILLAGAIAAFAIGAFYLIKFIQKASKKQKSFTLEAVILDLNGVIDFDMLAFVKSEDTGLLKMEFKDRKSDSLPPIPKHMIKNNIVILINYAPGHYAVLDSSQTMYYFNKQEWKVIPYNLGMKKFIMSEQRAAMNKAAKKILNWETYAPWITLGVAILSAMLLAWALFFFGLKIDSANIAARLAECKEAFRTG
jgi:hypothetical protein